MGSHVYTDRVMKRRNVETYLSKLSSLGDIALKTFEKTAVVGEECAILRSTATARNAGGSFHATVAGCRKHAQQEMGS